MQFHSNKIKALPSQAGFSLLELMITIGIIMLVTGLSLSRYSSFNNTILLKSQAFEIAFDIRQAQQSGISVRATQSDVRSAFGMYFNESNPSQYIFFQDLDDDEQYDSNEQLQSYSVDARFEITDIRVGGSSRSSAAVTFKRPNFDARISPGGGDLEIDVATDSSSSAIRTIRVTQSGQVTVQ